MKKTEREQRVHGLGRAGSRCAGMPTSIWPRSFFNDSVRARLSARCAVYRKNRPIVKPIVR